MFGYATDETPEFMPMPILFAHKLCRRLAEVRKNGQLDFLRPDGKAQVTLEYEDGAPKRVDAIVIASPIFFMGVTAQTKAMIDRCQCFWVERFVLKNRPYEGRRRPKGLFVSTAGGPKEKVFEPAVHVVKAFFSSIDYEYEGEVLMGNTDASDIVERKKAVLALAREAGKTLVK